MTLAGTSALHPNSPISSFHMDFTIVEERVEFRTGNCKYKQKQTKKCGNATWVVYDRGGRNKFRDSDSDSYGIPDGKYTVFLE
jgi:hypothetical protein